METTVPLIKSLSQIGLFTDLDPVLAYHQLPMASKDIVKTAVIRPFCLHKAAKSFQRFIKQVLRGLDFVYAYIGDVFIVTSNTKERWK